MYSYYSSNVKIHYCYSFYCYYRQYRKQVFVGPYRTVLFCQKGWFVYYKYSHVVKKVATDARSKPNIPLVRFLIEIDSML